MIRKAQCCCGRCVVEVKSDPVGQGACHCNKCKTRTGSAFGMGAYFKEQDVEIVGGITKIYALDSELGKQERHFFSSCGTTLYYYVEAFAGLIGIAGGCFIEAPLTAPDFSRANDNKYPWISFPETMKTNFSLDDMQGG